MKLAIADPPYLGRAVRWYGGGRGHFRDDRGQADEHPEAAEWDRATRHEQLVHDLVNAGFDGWAIAMASDSIRVYLNAAHDAGVRVDVMVWNRGNGMPSGSRLQNVWEPVLVHVPDERRGRRAGEHTPDVLNCSINPRAGFVGAKPSKWTRWVLSSLGYNPATDTVEDLFPGSGAVTAAIDGMLI